MEGALCIWEYVVAELVGDILCFSEAEADQLGAMLRHEASRFNRGSIGEAMSLLANQLTNRPQDRFEVHRFSISVEPMRTRQ